MHQYWRMAGLTLCVLLAAAGCNREESSLPKTQQSQQDSRPEENKADTVQAEKDEFLRKSREEIEQLKKQAATLEEKARNSSAELKAGLETQTKGLQENIKTVDKQWQDAKNASATVWQDAKSTLSASIEKLRQAIQSASS